MIDLIEILKNLHASLVPIRKMLTGFSYVLGLALVFTAFTKFKTIANAGHQSPSQEKPFVPVTYLAIGVGLIFMPSSFSVLANTFFGAESVLAYSNPSDTTVMSMMTFLMQTAGVLWFLRGSMLLVHSSEPGVKHGSKGLTFILSGILAMNFESTFGMLDSMFTYLFSVLADLKSNLINW
ncbi:MAG: type IV secretion protein IcmC [Legionellaceae bacterium]|nr:type IV secretion protein IcmC [Legionellaceae bacterium]